MKWTSDISSIFFDFDGLLVNTEALHFAAYQQMLRQNGVNLSWSFDHFISLAHKSAQGLRLYLKAKAPQLFQTKPWSILYGEKKTTYLTLLNTEEVKWMPGAEEMLETVREAELVHGVVTNATQKEIELIRQKIPRLREVSYWITREDYKEPKPAPDGYLKALEMIKKGKRAIGFEDTLKGVYALEKAGITPILICSPTHPQMKDISNPRFLYHSPSLTAFLNDPFTSFPESSL